MKFDSSNDKDLIEIEGTIEHIVYRNDSNGYTVCDLSVGDDYITAVGIMPFTSEGETVHAMGKWELHANFGRQFKVEYFEKQLPKTQTSILKYLSSGAVKGVGPVSAARIVEKFGEDSFEVIENHPEWLADIPGISPKKAKSISDSFKAAFGVRSVMMFCRDFFGPATAVKVYKRWGGAAVDIIKDNPYALCEEIYGIGFESADKIATSLGYDKTSIKRLKSGVKYFLSYNARQNGHVFVPKDKLVPAAAKLLGVSDEQISDATDSLLESSQIDIARYSGRDCVYLHEYYEAEKYIASKLDLLDRVFPKISSSDADRFISSLEVEFGIEYAPLQKRAIMSSISSGVMVLTGGPGTGKTTVIRALLTLFSRMGLKIALAAPTGRAAKRMSEATSHEAKTIHRLLETEFSDDLEPRFKRGENDRLTEDVVIIDEASMVDTLLMASLLHAVKPGARLILIGDSDQLPSVGAGYVLSDIIDSGRFSTVTLKDIFRQAGQSLIVTNAHLIKSGEYPDLEVKSKDFFFLPRQTDEEIANTVASLCAVRLPKKYGEGIVRDIQVITPSHKGAAGTDYLNNLLQSALNPGSKKKREKKFRDIVFREGDKVMQIKNNYDTEWHKDDKEGVGIFNGDIGTIVSINATAETMTINFDERIAEYDFSMLDELDHAYAITVHKSQGSEYPVVIIPAYPHSPGLLTRNLLYTAVTRAKDMVIIVGRADVVFAMVDNNRRVKRYTGLSFLLSDYAEK